MNRPALGRRILYSTYMSHETRMENTPGILFDLIWRITGNERTVTTAEFAEGWQ